MYRCRQAVSKTSSYVEQLLQRRRPSGGATFTQVAANLLNASRSYTHGKVITSKEAALIGLPVTHLPRCDNLWQAYWRLYCLQASPLAARRAAVRGEACLSSCGTESGELSLMGS